MTPNGAGADLAQLFAENEKSNPQSMSIVYGDKIRYSWGYIDAAHKTGYWFVKQVGGSSGVIASQRTEAGSLFPRVSPAVTLLR